MKQLKKQICNNARNNFCIAVDRVIPAVQIFGEGLASCLIQGEIVSDVGGFSHFADVWREDIGLAGQVKTCNERHSVRPTKTQVHTLYEETTGDSFIIEVKHGVYIIVFYDGVRDRSSRGPCRSKLARRMTDDERQKVLAQELQTVYVVDVCALQHIATSPQYAHVVRSGTTRLWNHDKLDKNFDRQILYLNRTFLKEVFESRRWKTHQQNTCFSFENGSVYRKTIPVRVIGAKPVVEVMEHVLRNRETITVPVAVLKRSAAEQKH